MTLLSHVYAVRELLSKGIASKDTQYSLSLIAHYLNMARAVLTEQKADKYRTISEQSFQSLCVELEKSSLHDCCNYPNANCVLLRSKTKLPKILNTRWGDFAKTMTLSGEVINKTSLTSNRHSKYSLTNKIPKPGWFVHDGYLFIINNTTLKIVLYNSLFDDPTEVMKTNCSTTKEELACKDYLEQEYPVDPDLVEPMYKKVLDLFRYTLALPPKDILNDAKDSQVSG